MFLRRTYLYIKFILIEKLNISTQISLNTLKKLIYSIMILLKLYSYVVFDNYKHT